MTLTHKTLGVLAIVVVVTAFAPSAAADTVPVPAGDSESAQACDTQAALPGDGAVARGDAGAIVIYRPLFQSRDSAAAPPFFSFSISDPGTQCFGSCNCTSCTCDSSCSLSECQDGCNDCFSRVDPGGCEQN